MVLVRALAVLLAGGGLGLGGVLLVRLFEQCGATAVVGHGARNRVPFVLCVFKNQNLSSVFQVAGRFRRHLMGTSREETAEKNPANRDAREEFGPDTLLVGSSAAPRGSGSIDQG